MPDRDRYPDCVLYCSVSVMSTQLERVVLGTVVLPNFAANGAIGTAAATVDIAPCFAIAQTTAGIALTIPNPTVTAIGQEVTFLNTGTTSVTVADLLIGVGRLGNFIYTAPLGWLSPALAIATGNALPGDLKSGWQTADHGSGWILINGRLLTTLTSTQQAAWATLGIAGANLPDATGRSFVQGTRGAQIGSSTITQANLPNINLTATSVSAGTPAGTISTQVNAQYHSATGGGFNGGRIQLTDRNPTFNQSNPSELTVSATFNGSALGTHSHSVSLGGSGTAYTPLSLGTNHFVFLGV
jgi:hypothetical protein